MARVRLSRWAVCAALCLLGIGLDAAAQRYPSKPIRLVVGFSPGGNVDITARLVAQKLSQSLGEPVIVDNRGGAGGMIGADLVAKSTPDGYTLLVVSSSHMINAATARHSPYDAVKDFSPVSTLTHGPHFVAVNAAMPVNSIQELIALARAKPGSINFGSAGTGSLTHLEGEFFKSAAGIDIVHVPYKSTNLAFTDLAGGHVQLVFSSTVSTLPFVRTGRVKALAVTSAKRLAAFPEIPTVAESGLPQFVVDSIAGMLAPAKTPRSIINKLSAEIRKFLSTPEMHRALAAQGAEAGGSTPKEYAERIAGEIARWRKVAADAGIARK
ncbi:MAG: tripartite tricarboxylate transporter substrate binding protein [Betaproteobacteria bacterium]|nr:tripartite tricarboxylate transporter substrate binding protein [Betaproteobacteria bacterium]